MEIERTIGEIKLQVEYIFLDFQSVLDWSQEKTVLAKDNFA